VVLAGIGGSNLHAYRGHYTAGTPPLVLGHEAAARTPDGSRVAIFPLIGCGACRACRRGERSRCERCVSVDLAIDAVGAQQTWTAGMRAAHAGRAVVIVGLAQANGSMPVGDLVRRRISIRGHYACERGDFDAAISLLTTAPPQLGGPPILPLGKEPKHSAAWPQIWTLSSRFCCGPVRMRICPAEAPSALATAVRQPGSASLPLTASTKEELL
jgi:hypothetical protein